jgi:general stress protein 26
MHKDNADRRHDVDEVARLIKDIRIAMLTTVDAQGRLVSRPLDTRERPFDGTLYFFTAADADKVAQLRARPEVNVAYVDVDEQRYVSIAGRATMVDDRAMIHALWDTPTDGFWFEGKDDPNLLLLRVDAESAACWTSAGTALGRAFNFLTALVTRNQEAAGKQTHVDFPPQSRSPS